MRYLRCAVAIVTVVATSGGGSAVAAERPASGFGRPGAPGSSGFTVTLLTGDRVDVTERAGGRVTTAVRPAPGREKIGFIARGGGLDAEVLPTDAAPLVAAGRLDRRLFQVRRLGRDGFDDGHTADLPLIATGATPTGARAVRPLASVGATALKVAKADTGALWGSIRAGAPAKVWLDGKIKAADAASNTQIGVPAARQRGATGKGVPAAILDTGLDPRHPDLAGPVIGGRDFTGNPDGTVDGYGHGTHVASIVAGTGAASGGRYAGVAPDARLLIGKVCDNGGSCDDSAVVAGMEWAVAEGARVVNLSLGSDGGDGTDPLSLAVNRLTAASGALFVCAAGNAGGDHLVGSPSVADAALSVGSVGRTDLLSDFSSRGPRGGDGSVKPDITAPGEDIVGARAAGTGIGDPVGDDYVTSSGTSMA